MKKLTNKKIETSIQILQGQNANGTFTIQEVKEEHTYSALIRPLIQVNPEGLKDMDEVMKRMRILEALDSANGTIEFKKEEDAAFVKECCSVNKGIWKIVSKEMVDFYKELESL